jgi:hypothetical protein
MMSAFAAAVRWGRDMDIAAGLLDRMIEETEGVVSLLKLFKTAATRVVRELKL